MNVRVATAVAVSPAMIVSAAASIVKLSAKTEAFDGITESVPNDKAAAKATAIFLNEFILFYSPLFLCIL
jgi:hypothetical protein